MFKMNTKLIVALSVFGVIVLSVFVYNSFSQFSSHAEKANSIEESQAVQDVKVEKEETSTDASVNTTVAEEEKTEEVETALEDEVKDTKSTEKEKSKVNEQTTNEEVSTKKEESLYQVTNKNVTGNEAKFSVTVPSDTSSKTLIDVAKEVNDTSKSKTTISYSTDTTVTLNNETKTGELSRNYTYSENQVDYGKVNYEVVGASTAGNKAIIKVVSPNASSSNMYDVSKELSNLINEANSKITKTDVYFYNSKADVSSGNYKWKYSDSTPTKVTKRETFKF